MKTRATFCRRPEPKGEGDLSMLKDREPPPESKFEVIVADPPWAFGDKLRQSRVKRGAEDQYPVLSDNEVAELPILPLLAANAVLALWVPASKLADGLRVLASWGFTHKQVWVWVKTVKDKALGEDGMPKLAMGMGHLARGACEICLIGVRGSPYKANCDRSIRNVFFAPVGKHSQKPEAVQDALDRMFPTAKKLELFARRDRKGWITLGNEVPTDPCEDIRAALEELAKPPQDQPGSQDAAAVVSAKPGVPRPITFSRKRRTSKSG